MTRELFRGLFTLLLAVGLTFALTGCDVDDDSACDDAGVCPDGGSAGAG